MPESLIRARLASFCPSAAASSRSCTSSLPSSLPSSSSSSRRRLVPMVDSVDSDGVVVGTSASMWIVLS